MKWFQGTIPEAITTSKAKKAVFVVFIEGQDETSQEVSRNLDSAEVASRLESENFVAIKLQSNSENYTFFAQIYQFVPVPSIFFIGENGKPLEIIANVLPVAELASKVDSILEKANPKEKDASTSLIKADPEVNSSSCNPEESKDSSNNDNAASCSTASEVENSTVKTENSTDDALKDVSSEEKLKRARELIELQKKKKQEEDERREREREIERRKSGRDLQKLRQIQQDKEIKEAQQERLREKAAEAAAREKILKQIAEDKLERKRKHDMQLQQKQKLQEDTEVKVKPQVQATSVDLSKTRIQFRLPSGNPITGTFDSSSTLGTLRSYVLQNAQLPFRQFSMSVFFPRKDFTSSDDDKTLLELDLAPSSVILILPIKSNNPTSVVKSSDGAGIFSHFFWTLFAPVMSMYNYIMGYFTGRPRSGETESSRDNRNSGGAGITENSNISLSQFAANMGMRRLGGEEATKIRSRGNVHTLHSNDNDNDENNTWNGNSTQQM